MAARAVIALSNVILHRRREALGTVIDVVFGTLWYRLLATREPIGRGLAGELVTLLAGHGASTAEIR